MPSIANRIQRANPFGQVFADLYRSVSEADTIAMLVLEAFAFVRDQAVAQARARTALERWLEGGLGVRHTQRGRLFDPVEVISFATMAGLAGADDLWERSLVGTLRAFVTELDRERRNTVALAFRRRFDVSRIPQGQTLRLRMPLPLKARYARVDIRVDPQPEAEACRVDDGRLEAKVVRGAEPEVVLGARIDLDLTAVSPELPPTNDIWLRGRDGLVVISPQIEELSRALALPGASPRSAVQAFWDFLLDNFSFCPVHYDQVPADAPLDWVLRTGVYDCQLASALFVALCRARGLHARILGGNFLYRRSPTNHYWAEVWLDELGWKPFDFICWDLSYGGRDLAWRNRFFADLEPRLVTECFPGAFTGRLGVPVPEQWHIVRTPRDGGVDIHFAGVGGETVFHDEIAVLGRRAAAVVAGDKSQALPAGSEGGAGLDDEEELWR